MSVLALVSGAIFRVPEKRTSKAGKPFVTTTIKATSGNELQFWRVSAFSDTAQAELLRLDVGDAVAVQGPVRIEQYEREGATRQSFSVVAENVLALRQPTKTREKRLQKLPVDANSAGAQSARSIPFDDDVGF
jgi:single-stranded DNA-binding protein